MEPSVSVVIRAKDEGESIGRTLDLLARQSREHEVVLVDSGSTDATVEIARGRGVDVIEIPAEEFTYGGALNTGCAAASGEILVALSAHAFQTDSAWLERIVAVLADDAGCVRLRPAVRPGRERALRGGPPGRGAGAGAARLGLLERGRGVSAQASGSSTSSAPTCRRPRTRSGRCTGSTAAICCVLGPEYLVEHDHSKDGMLDQYQRARREWRGLAMMGSASPTRRARWFASGGPTRTPTAPAAGRGSATGARPGCSGATRGCAGLIPREANRRRSAWRKRRTANGIPCSR